MFNEYEKPIGAICCKKITGEKEITFEEILLNESLVQGEIWVERQALCTAGGMNDQLISKRNYELLLRIAKQFSVLYVNEEKKKEYLQEEKNWKRLEPDEYFEENSPDLDAWKTNCYLISRYKKELIEMKCFDDAVNGVILDGGGQAVKYLEQMLSATEEYYRIYDSTQPILIYAGDDICYHVLDTFARCLGNAFQKLGYSVIYFDMSKRKIEDIVDYVGIRLKAVIGMQTYMFSVKKNDGSYLHDAIGAAEYHFVFDHPVWLRNHLICGPKQMTVLTPDGNYAVFVEKYYGHKARFLPPAGQEDFYCGQENRVYDISFLGTYGDSLLKELRELRENDRKKAFMVSRYIRYMRQDMNNTPEQALERLLDYYGISCTKEEFEKQFYSLRWTMLKLAHYYRRKTVEVLLKAGLTIHVFGNSWKDSPLCKYPGLICHEQAVGEQALKVYGNSKLSLNIMTWHKDGFTERIANAMLQKSVVVTDRTVYLEKNFTDGEDMLIFGLENLQELPERMKALLIDEEKRKKIAECGYQKAKKGHTWQKRAEQLLELMKE